ncbi:flagellin [Aquibacillus koreensis]|uniref:Flagellin n=1 Tax=Aquibacillus koreensis TaxID=279446 RepID=A0A9X3WML8_9BACI|nr:flagellin [Aquibacillus koreensis]MCT2537257.1 flagellin [Aquibacillus koreensis]MDC3421605.1 flagellin [Aquibacillus koreensis]
MRINHNIAALNTHRQLGSAQNAQQNSMEKLASGLRINGASDDAAGLAISEKMRGQIRGLDMAAKNSQDATSMIQTAEGGLNETHSILQRMRELAVQSSNDTNTPEDRQNIQDEMNQLGEEIQRIGDQTEFNKKSLLNGDISDAGTATAHVTTNSLEGTMVTATTLNAVLDSDGNSVGIEDGDTITATWSVNGTQHSKTLELSSPGDAGTETLGTLATALSDASNTFAVVDGDNAITATAQTDGKTAQINGLSIEVKSADGVRKEAASNALSNFKTTTEADDASNNDSQTFQIGANAGQTLNLGIEDMRADALGVRNLQVGSQSQASTAINVIDEAIATVSEERSKLGATQNRLDHTINNLNTSSENLTAAESRIRDVDMAKEMMNQTKNSILGQAAQAMLAQANSAPQGVLQLLQ